MVVPTVNPRRRHQGRAFGRTVPPTGVVTIILLLFLLTVSSYNYYYYRIRSVAQGLVKEEKEEKEEQDADKSPRDSWMLPPYDHFDKRNHPHNHNHHTDKKYASTRLGARRKSEREEEGPLSSTTSSSHQHQHQKKPFLIYRPPLEGAQGMGNLLNGLLAAHWLGQEFHCIVCVSPDWKDFHMAWESLTPECTRLTTTTTTTTDPDPDPLPPRTLGNTVWILNYSKQPVNECDVKAQLQAVVDEDDRVVYLVANDYPRWPSSSSKSRNLGVDWNDLYRPTAALQETWTRAVWPAATATAPVVHLRAPDDDKDHRRGLDLATCRALGEHLRSHHYPNRTTTTTPFLVTNQVDYYTWFQEHYGWAHPSWTGVRHSALPNVQWTKSSKTNNRSEGILQLWTDWWTLYRAKVIYHTHSDFSRSAARWSQCQESYTIGGIEGRSGTLLLTKDLWWGDDNDNNNNNEVAPLSERSNDALLHCDIRDYGIGQAFDLDDGIHDDLDMKQGAAG